MRANIKSGVIVQYIGHDRVIPYGTLGDVIDPPFGGVRVRWQNGIFTLIHDMNLEDSLWLIADVR